VRLRVAACTDPDVRHYPIRLLPWVGDGKLPWTTESGPMAGWPYMRRRLGHARPALRPVRVTWRLFPLVTVLPSTHSAARPGALFAGFFGTMLVSDCSGPCITGDELCSSRCGPPNHHVASPELSQFPRKERARMLGV
jgi:hypothetical protein